MAEQVQAILERMVPLLKDLRSRGLFSPDEIRSIVDRRRQSEYLLQRRSAARKSDYLRYIEEEILLERLRKLRKEKVLTDMRNERIRRLQEKDGSDSDDSDGDRGRKHAYQISGPGDSHILSHVHFLYQRTLKKFHYPLDVMLNYAQFAKDYKSFHMLSRIYAEGLQHHPREAGLWIEAASFEYFGYVAQDYENASKGGTDSDNVNSKVVGSSIQNARVLMQRGLRINKSSAELWLQYFALELHYVQKLRGRKEILELGKLAEERDSDGDSDGDEVTKISTAILPSQIIFKNAIKAIPNDIQFRLKFVEACRQFPQTKGLENCIMESITGDFGNSVEAWVARISYVEEEMQKKAARNGKSDVVGFLGGAQDDSDNENADKDKGPPSKKARVESDSKAVDPALTLLQEALEAAPTSKMYFEGSQFLRLRIQSLLEYENDEGEDVSHLIGNDEDAEKASQRHVLLLEALYQNAKEKDIFSASLTLDQVDFMLSTEQPKKAEKLLRDVVSSNKDGEAQLWLRWAEIAKQLEESSTAIPSSSPTRILRQALKHTLLHDRKAHTLILTELMKHLMVQPLSPKANDELKSLFQKLLLLSQGSSVSLSNIKRSDDEEDAEDCEEVNMASSFLAYLNYTMLNSDKDDAVRTIYTSILYHSNYGKSCSGKTEEEVMTMKAFFDTCIEFEMQNKKKENKKTQKMCLCKLYENSIGFYESGGSSWRKVVDGYQRGLQDVKYSF